MGIRMGIVTEPKVVVVGSTQFHLSGLHEFVDAEGLHEIALDPSTPLAKLISSIENDGPYTSPELMPEFGGRFCYESWAKGRETKEYNENILEEAHGSVLQHATFNIVITGVSRALTHELIRHAAGVGISQQSQRYVNLDNPRFVMPPALLHYIGTNSAEAQEWLTEQREALQSYKKWQEYLRFVMKEEDQPATIRKKRANEAARGSLPNSIETKLLWTANIRALRHVVETRGASEADLEIRRLAVELAKVGRKLAPTLFNDVDFVRTDDDFGVPTVVTHYRKV